MVRHSELLQKVTGVDSDAPVQDLLIRFCAAFLDQGLAHWQLPRREEGFYRSFCSLYRQRGGLAARWMRRLREELARIEDQKIGPLQSIHESLEILGVGEDEWEEFLSATLLALRGWGGMVRQVELRGDRVVQPVPEGSLVEFLAIRLLLDRLSIAEKAREALGYKGPLSLLREVLQIHVKPIWVPSVEQRAFLIFQLAQVFGLPPDVLHRLERSEWACLLRESERFSQVERRRVFHLAYERRFYEQTLDAVAAHSRNPAPTPRQPRFMAVFCIDEREESIRRHLEEVAPDCVTLATAGFYSIPMYYRGADDAHFVPLCPPVIVPSHYVVEQAVEGLSDFQGRRVKTRRALGMAQHRFHRGSRSFAIGAVLSTAVGVLASVPLVARTLFPRLTSRVRSRFGSFVSAPATRLQLERSDPTPGPMDGHIGFSLEEMTNIGEKVLRELGLTHDFPRLILVFGHGSSSMNNPHESAHDCGACGGARGGPNGRAFAQMLNERRVRAGLVARGLTIPNETVFVGGMHNTSNEKATLYDLDMIPRSHRDEFAAVLEDVEEACNRDAHERSRRFHSAPLTLSPAAARLQVEARAEDLAQVRPEWGHATNAITIVGRRSMTRGLFLDRRAFLVSYDPTKDDDDATVLARILGAVFPVCAGISLEYYFSSVDNPGWGSGTKLPHNITALVGVMDGATSDLRTGLPWQMVEIHEPVRNLFIVETTADTMLRVASLNETVGKLCRNGWVRLAIIHPETHQLSLYENGSFLPYQPTTTALPKADSSGDWYRGWREHLEFAEIVGSPGNITNGH
jgi:uncharacterized protein YbcC (UPF0753/DUF2309 family)